MDKHPDEIPVYMSEEEAKRFISFQRFQSLFLLLEENDIDSMVNGSITIHFDRFGKVRSVEKRQNWFYQ